MTTKRPEKDSTTASPSSTQEESTGASSSSSTATESTSPTPTSQEKTTAETTPTQQPETGEQPEGEEEAHEDEESGKDARTSEARKYRQRAQHAEAERDQLRDQVGALQHSILASAATARGVGIDALTAAGHDVSDLFDGSEINSEKLTAAITDTATRFGIRTGVVPTQGTGGPAPRVDAEASRKGWSDAFDEANTPHHRLL